MEEEKDRIITLPSVLMQLVGRTLGIYATTYLGNDLYYLDRAVTLLESYVKRIKDESWLEEKYPDYKKVRSLLEEIRPKIYQLKKYYDLIEDKKFDNSERNKKEKQEFFRISSSLSLIHEEIYDYFVFLSMITNLHRYSIPAEAFKAIEHAGFKKFQLDAKKATTTPAPQPAENTNP